MGATYGGQRPAVRPSADQRPTVTDTTAPVPLTTGSPRSRTLDVGPFRVTDASFPAGLVLDPHLHDRGSVVVILDGGFELGFRRRSYDCLPATVISEPVDDDHANRFSRTGARVIALQPDHRTAATALGPCAALFDTVATRRDDRVRTLGWRIAHELAAPDALSTTAVHGLGLELLAATSRLDQPRSAAPPAWLADVEALLHDRFREGVGLTDAAAVAGVHPVHLARVFRRHHHDSVGGFVRRLRLEWAVRQLATTDIPLVDVARRAGYADQSHLTRAVTAHLGVPPGRFRREVRRGS